MTLLIKLQGVLTSTAGLPKLVTLANGFPDSGLTDLFLFADGAGTLPANSVAGRATGLIEAPQQINNGFSWLPGGGGLSLSGSQIVSAPASDASTAWTLVSAGALVGSVGGTATERICGLLGYKQFTDVPARGAVAYARGSNDWNAGSPAPYYQTRATNNGVIGGSTNATPTALTEVGKRRLRVLSYNGSNQIAMTVYDKDATVVASAIFAATDTEMFTAASTTLTALAPTVGISSSTYAGGTQQVEAFARYSRVLDATDIATIVETCKALGVARGRAWS